MAIFKKPAATAERIVVPTLESISPEHARLQARDRELRNRIAQIDSELDRLRVTKPFVSSDARVAALVDGLAAPPTADVEDNNLQRREALHQERSDTVAAIEVVRQRLATERLSASREAWRTLAPVHREKVAKLCRALVEALKAHNELHAFRGAVADADLSWIGAPQLIADYVLGDPLDRQSNVRRLLEEAVRDGFLDRTEVADA
jgi:hypothetical protein